MTTKQETTGKIHEALANVMADIEAIGKDQRNKTQGFMFRGIDQAYNAIHPLMAKYRIITVPRVVDMLAREERETKSGSVLSFTLLSVEYDFICGEDGSKVTVGPVIGEGMDSGDKSCNKALAIAHKYALFQTFLIPTEKTDDPDAEAPEPITARAKVKVKKAAAVVEQEDFDDVDLPDLPELPELGGDDDSSLAIIDTPAGAKFVADQLINLCNMHTNVKSLRDFWKKSLRPINKLQQEFPEEYQRVLAHFIKRTNTFKEQE